MSTPAAAPTVSTPTRGGRSWLCLIPFVLLVAAVVYFIAMPIVMQYSLGQQQAGEHDDGQQHRIGHRVPAAQRGKAQPGQPGEEGGGQRRERVARARGRARAGEPRAAAVGAGARGRCPATGCCCPAAGGPSGGCAAGGPGD